MTVREEPVLGNWYRNLDTEQDFQVVAYDEIGGIVEIQHDDGEVEAMELDEWFVRDLDAIEAPDEWSVSGHDENEDDDDESWSARRRVWDDEGSDDLA